MSGGIEVRPVGEVPWADVETVFGTRGDPAGCWCQWYKLPTADWKATGREERKELLCGQVSQEPSPGLVAYREGEPVGWCAVEPRAVYERLRTAKVAAEVADTFDDPSVWSITCFVVRVGHRKRGVAHALVAAAVEHARKHGAGSVEAYPVDTEERPGMPSADLYHGTVRLFAGAGLEVVSRPLPGRAIMRLALA